MANDKPNATPEEAPIVAPHSLPTRWVRVSHKTPDHVAAHWPYAAYGSNLALGQMATRCPMADILGPGMLRGARLVFARYLSIGTDDASSVPMGVYRLNAADIASMDRREGLGRSYDRYLVTVEMSGQAVRCFTYIKRNNDPHAPSDQYYATCLQGYADWRFESRRLRHARDYARRNQKPEPKYKGRMDDRNFSFDDWYYATYPRKGNGTASDGDEFIPEDADCEIIPPHRSLVTGRMLNGHKRRYEDMRPDEIKAALKRHDKRDSIDRFTGKNGQKWVKGRDGIWVRDNTD